MKPGYETGVLPSRRARSMILAADPFVGHMKAFVALVALSACVAPGFIAPPGASAAPPVLRLSGSFMQYWGEMQGWAPETWQAVLDQMKAVKMNTVIVQMLVQENNDGTLYSFIGPSGQPDATETILNYADTNGFRVFLGLYMPNWNHDMIGSNFLYETQGRMAVVAQQAWNRYLSGNRHSSFAGWYIPYEPWTANYQAAEVQRLRAFFQTIHASCQFGSNDVPLAISPFISSYRPPPCQVEQLYRQLLDQAGIDILLLQDSVGAQQWESNILQHVAPYFQAFQNACSSTGVKFWANLESFKISNGVYGPCDAARLRKQLDATAPFVKEFVTFDFLHYMNPVAFLSGWDQTRRAQMQQLFADYKAGFADTDYAPFAPPNLAASLAGNNLVAKWRGIAGDQFQVEFKTNLAFAPWTPLTTQMFTNGTEFSVLDPILAGQNARAYRVSKLPRLQVPDSMVYIPPGTFRMGTPTNDPNKTPNELSQFQVTLTCGFWINQFEVTQSEYQNLTCTNPATFTGDLDRPVENISWRNAMDYCSLLTQQERQALRLPDGYVYRLPTEAEWEYAARAGTTNWFSFGNDPELLPNYAWYDGNSQWTTHPVGQLQSNPWGLKDVHGNVFEWCWDWIDSAPTQPVTDFRGSTNDLYHAIRGGASSFPWVDCRSSWRIGYSAASVAFDVGFRIVLAPAGP
jgi:formylglycine-generating enzyme required for sulfatase activity